MSEVTTVSTGSWALTCEAWGGDRACFAVWSPNAERVAAVGDFNEWDTFAYNYSQNEVQSFLMSSAGSGRAARRRKAVESASGQVISIEAAGLTLFGRKEGRTLRVAQGKEIAET